MKTECTMNFASNIPFLCKICIQNPPENGVSMLSVKTETHEEPNGKYIYLKSVVRPTSEFHFAILIVEGKPCNIYFTSRFKYSRRNICTTTSVSNHNICWVCTIKCFISTKVYKVKNNKISHTPNLENHQDTSNKRISLYFLV